MADELQEARRNLYEYGLPRQAIRLVGPLMAKRPLPVDAVEIYAAAQVLTSEIRARTALAKLPQDLLPVKLALCDLELRYLNLEEAAETLHELEVKWPDDLLVQCRRIIYLATLHSLFQDAGEYYEEAIALNARLRAPVNRLEASWLHCAKRRLVRESNGGKGFLSPEECQREGLYFVVASGWLVDRWQDAHDCGDRYLQGHGVERNLAEAIKWYVRAAQEGSAIAACRLGKIYSEEDVGNAVHWCRKAAEMGNAEAQYGLGMIYCDDAADTRKDIAEGLRWLHRAARQNHLPAQERLLRIYSIGEGVERNLEEAQKWHRKVQHQYRKMARLGALRTPIEDT